MAMYIVTSDRLIWPRGTAIDTADLKHSNIEALLRGGHISTFDAEKPAKTKTRKTKD